MARREVADVAELKTLVGQEVAVGEWFSVDQERIDRFADATLDHQWIHVNPEKCKTDSPFGVTIAHGFLTLSLLPYLTQQAFGLKAKMAMSLNYGLNKLRFTSPVKVGSRIRVRMQLLEVSDIQGGWQMRWLDTVEIEGQEKPALVAEWIGRTYSN